MPKAAPDRRLIWKSSIRRSAFIGATRRPMIPRSTWDRADRMTRMQSVRRGPAKFPPILMTLVTVLRAASYAVDSNGEAIVDQKRRLFHGLKRLLRLGLTSETPKRASAYITTLRQCCTGDAPGFQPYIPYQKGVGS